MIEMSNDKLLGTILLKPCQDMEQSHAVGSTRDGHHDRTIGPIKRQTLVQNCGDGLKVIVLFLHVRFDSQSDMFRTSGQSRNLQASLVVAP